MSTCPLQINAVQAPQMSTSAVLRSVHHKSLAVRDLIVEQNIDDLALTKSWHKRASDVCLISLLPRGYILIEQSRPV